MTDLPKDTLCGWCDNLCGVSYVPGNGIMVECSGFGSDGSEKREFVPEGGCCDGFSDQNYREYIQQQMDEEAEAEAWAMYVNENYDFERGDWRY